MYQGFIDPDTGENNYSVFKNSSNGVTSGSINYNVCKLFWSKQSIPKNSDFVEVIAGYDDLVERIFRMIKENRVDLYADNELVLQHASNLLNLNNELKIVRPGLEKIN